jgi:hypothetical protein
MSMRTLDAQPDSRVNTDWWIDSGTTQHMSDQFSIFSNFTSVKPGSWPVKGIEATNQPL